MFEITHAHTTLPLFAFFFLLLFKLTVVQSVFCVYITIVNLELDITYLNFKIYLKTQDMLAKKNAVKHHFFPKTAQKLVFFTVKWWNFIMKQG